MRRGQGPSDSARSTPSSPLSPHARPTASRALGFTLIELLVVLIIIGVLATMVSLSVSGRAVDDRMQAESRRIESLLKLALDEAQAKGYELGLRHTEAGFDFLTLEGSGQWVAVEDGPFRPRQIEPPFYLELRVEGRLVKPVVNAPPANEGKDKESDAPKLEPQVLILSTGEMTPFTLDLRLKDVKRYYRVEGDALGQLKSERGEDKT